MTDRYQPEHLEAWRRDGGVVIESFFNADEIAAVQADFEEVFGRSSGADEGISIKKDGEIGRFNPAQFTTIQSVPLPCSPALNLIGVHPALVDFAKQALGTDDVHLYQCQAWAKFTGDADYDQPFHCDFVNHTLTVPSDDARENSITILCYFTEVTDAHGPANFVTRPDSDEICGPEMTLSMDPEVQERLQASLRQRARSSAGPAGTIFPYTVDVYHRGTNMTAPGGRRYAVMSCFKKAQNDSIAFTAWAHSHMKPWARIFDHATPEQLACFGVQRPGHPFWTEETLRLAQVRYPNWDLTPYREAMAVAEPA